MKSTSGAAFETAIEAVLLANGYVRVEAQGFDRERTPSLYPPGIADLQSASMNCRVQLGDPGFSTSGKARRFG